MVDKAQKNNIKVVLCSVIPAYDYPWRKGLHPNEKIPKLNAMLKELAEKRAVFYLDYFSAMAKEDNALIDDYGYDGVHPNKAGYEVMEPLVEDAIKTVLKN
jgi:lysophospholipase L1-like esterase